MKKGMDVCMLKGCDSPHYARGLCCGCYQSALAKIRNGECSEGDLIAAKLIKACEKRGPKPKSAFAKEFERSQCAKKRKESRRG
jgi:hypothetical protein